MFCDSNRCLRAGRMIVSFCAEEKPFCLVVNSTLTVSRNSIWDRAQCELVFCRWFSMVRRISSQLIKKKELQCNYCTCHCSSRGQFLEIARTSTVHRFNFNHEVWKCYYFQLNYYEMAAHSIQFSSRGKTKPKPVIITFRNFIAFASQFGRFTSIHLMIEHRFSCPIYLPIFNNWIVSFTKIWFASVLCVFVLVFSVCVFLCSA